MRRAKRARPESDRIIRVDVYHAVVGVCFTKRTMRALLRVLDMDLKLADACQGLAIHATRRGVEWFCVYLPKNAGHDTVAHEMLHVAWYILHAYGVAVDEDNQEPLAHLMGHLIREFEAIRA